MKTLISLLTIAIAAAALMTAWLSFKSARDARATLAEISSRRVKLDAEVQTAQQHLTAASHDEKELQAVLTQVRSEAEKPVGPAKKAGNPGVRPPTNAETLALMEANPELHALFKRSVQGGLGQRFLSFYQAANLTPVQIRKFEELMTQNAEDKMDLATIMQKQGVAPTDPAVPKMRQQMDAKLEASQQEVLGEAGYQQLQQFMRTEPVAGFLNDVASLVRDGSAPLTQPQASRLREILANASTTYQTGGKADPATIDWSRVMEQTQGFLTPAQLTALKADAQLPQVFELVKQFYQQQGQPPEK